MSAKLEKGGGPTGTYFFLADFAPRSVTEIGAHLMKHGTLVKPLDDARLGSGHIRVTPALPEDNARFVEALKEVL